MPDAVVPPPQRPDRRRAERDRYPFAVELQTRWGDMDFQRHLNNVSLARYYEEARIRWLARVSEPVGEPFGGVVASARFDYLADVRYPAPVDVAVGVAEVGRSSVRVLQAMFQAEACVGLADVTLVRRPPGGPEPLPEQWREHLSPYLLR